MKKKDMKNKSFLMISVIMEQTEAKEQEVVQLPDEPSMDDSSSSTEKFENKDNWPDVEELVIKGVMRLRSIYWQMVAIWIA